MEQVWWLLVPTLYWLVGQALHLNALVVPPQDPERNWPPGQVARAAVAHVLQLVALLVPALYLSDWQVLHMYVLVVPPHTPERCWPAGQVARAHGMHFPGMDPSRYWLGMHPMFGGGGVGAGGGFVSPSPGTGPHECTPYVKARCVAH